MCFVSDSVRHPFELTFNFGKKKSLLERDQGCRVDVGFCLSPETFGRKVVDCQSTFVPVPCSLRNWAELRVNKLNIEKLKFLKSILFYNLL